MHGFEEKLVRYYEARATNGVGHGNGDNGQAEDDTTTAETDKKSKTKKKDKKAAAGPPSAAVGLRIPLTSGDVAFLVEEVYRGRSAVSGLPTRTTLVRWQLPEGPTGASAATTTVESLLDRVRPAAEDLEGDVPLQPEQRTAKLQLADLVCMTREEASRHQDLVLFKGQSLASLYDEPTLARIEARRREAAEYEAYR